MIDLSPHTDNGEPIFTKSWSVLSNNCIPDRLKQLKILDDENANFLYSPNSPIFFMQMKNCFPLVLSKRVYPVFLRTQVNSAQNKAAKQKRTSSGDFSKRSLVFFSEGNFLKAKNRFSAVQKRLATKKRHYSSRH